ncbi:MAG: pantoate--beta-alanine ligase [Candidatus Firestonebacteria bacterium]
MRVISDIAEMTSFSQQKNAAGLSIGFVPTMGYLHPGHVSLVKQAAKECGAVVVSIFVNPTQFGPGEDLAAYPRNLKRDLEILDALKVDVVFTPEAKAMYPAGYGTFVNLETPLTGKLCGEFRPGHFKGVATVVAKLFNIVLPQKAYFGQKDAQQCIVIKKMAAELNFPVNIVILPTLREKDGLAMSSRNTYLSAEERKAAPEIYQSLLLAKKMIEAGELRAEKITSAVRKKLAGLKNAEIQYVAVVNASSLEAPVLLSCEILLAVAVKLGKTRLIDNILLQLS